MRLGVAVRHLLLAILLLVGGLAYADLSTARARFEQALQVHGGEAFAQLAQKGVRLSIEVTSERGGKSDVKITLYRKGEKVRTEVNTAARPKSSASTAKTAGASRATSSPKSHRRKSRAFWTTATTTS